MLAESFLKMSRTSRSKIARIRFGIQRGERLLIMLGNIVPLWEVTLAAMKLGVVISPATTLLTPADLQDRVERGGVRHVITDLSSVGKVNALNGLATRICAPLLGYADNGLSKPIGWRNSIQYVRFAAAEILIAYSVPPGDSIGESE